MSTEAIAITGVLILCWTVLVIADAMTSGVLAVLTSLTFKQAFLKGLLVLPTCLHCIWSMDRQRKATGKGSGA